MRAWSAIAFVLWLALLCYTVVVIGKHGLGLLPIFFGDIGKLTWPGQFNADFLLMLFASASWVMWRNRFTAKAIALGVAAFFLGASFLLPYLVWLIRQNRGDLAAVLLGPNFRKD